jgi:hypothetical protein
MPCTSPIRGYRAPGGQIKFSRAGAWVDRPMTVRCGQCIDCKLKRTYDWALRCMHEASLYEQNCMITLTYNDESLPKDMGLDLYAHQLFFKRFRKKFSEKKFAFSCAVNTVKNIFVLIIITSFLVMILMINIIMILATELNIIDHLR